MIQTNHGNSSIWDKRNELDVNKLDLDFLVEDREEKNLNKYIKLKNKAYYKIVLADDDADIHRITKLIFKDFTLDGRGLEFIDTYSGAEAMEVLKLNPDTAVIFLDVVMEEKDSGLKVVRYLRNELKNSNTRVVLRTGQPGEAPEEKIIAEYDINDYKLKTDLTKQKLFTTMYACLRSYRDILTIEKHRRGLEKIVAASANLFVQNSLSDFLCCILEQVSSFRDESSDSLYIVEKSQNNITDPLAEKILVNKKQYTAEGFICSSGYLSRTIIAASGKYSRFVGLEMDKVMELDKICREINNINLNDETPFTVIEDGVLIFNKGDRNLRNYVFIENTNIEYDMELVKLFLTNYSLALDNYQLSRMVLNTQDALIYTFAEVIECHFAEASSHVRRVSEMMYMLAEKLDYSTNQCELLKVSSTMHDIGKIGIPDSILKKPGKLTLEEFEIIKEHTKLGYNILKDSELYTFKEGAIIALYHHERYDGKGYPEGLTGEEIPLIARMMSIVDVFDALSHKRVYKEAWEIDKTLDYLIENKGTQFDPRLVDIFVDNYEEFKKVLDNNIK